MSGLILFFDKDFVNELFHSVVVQFGVRHALACRIARQTEVYRTFALKLHHNLAEHIVDKLSSTLIESKY